MNAGYEARFRAGGIGSRWQAGVGGATVVRFAWIDERPFNYVEASELVGCDVALARLAIEAAGHTFEPVQTTFGEMLPGLGEGRWDVTTGMFVTPERQKVAHFTAPIWSLSDGLLVSADEHRVAGYGDVARLGLPLAVLRGQVQGAHALRHGVASGSLALFDTYADAAAAVRRGDVVAYASVALAHQEHLAATSDGALRLVRITSDEALPSTGAFACASAELRNLIDVQLRRITDIDHPHEPSPNPAMWVS